MVKKTHTLAIIQARMSSSRLPGKMLLPLINSKSVLEFLYDRIKQSKKIDSIIIATSNEKSDDAIEKVCKANKINCFRGSLNNVLERFYQAASTFKQVTHIVRLTGDCPLHDPKLIDSIIDTCIKKNYDYVSNTQPATFPDGFDCEVFTFNTLKSAIKNATSNFEKEHVTPFMYQKKLFNTYNIESKINYSNYRVTLDEQKDYELIKLIVQSFPKNNTSIDYITIINLLKNNPNWVMLNEHIKRNEGSQQ